MLLREGRILLYLKMKRIKMRGEERQCEGGKSMGESTAVVQGV